MFFSRAVVLFAMLAMVLALASSTQAESFLLKSGGRLEGEWLNPKRATADAYEMRTPEGIRLVLNREQVVKVFIKSDLERDYEKLLPRMPNTVEGQWKMAEWCKDAGLKAKREHHLQEVIKAEPAHEAARIALGYQRYEGAWQKPEEHMASLGYVRFQGRWATPQDIEIAKQEADANAAIVEWRQKIRLWKSWLTKKRDLEAKENFRTIRDPLAASILEELLEDDENSLDLRLMALDALEPLTGRPGEGTFIRLAVSDATARIRDKCLEALAKYESKRAVFRFMSQLKSSDNPKVQRAASALAFMKDPLAIPALIDALVTTHEFTVIPGNAAPGGAGQMGGAFGRDSSGAVGGGGGMTWGTPRPVKIKSEIKNDAVLGALTAIVPGVNFVFNEAAWKQWYVGEHEPAVVNLRRAN